MSENPSIFGLIEPDWSLTFSDDLEITAVRRYWRQAVQAMRDMGTLVPENEPAIMRLMLVYVMWDRNAREVGEHGAVLAPKKKNSRAIARVSPHFTAMTTLSKEALALESDLGLTPRSAGKVSQARRKANRAEIGGGYLKVVRPASDEFLSPASRRGPRRRL
jgi:P27 family predicted phage terminase small subunit